MNRRLQIPASAIRSPLLRTWLEALAHPYRQFQAHQLGEAWIRSLRGDA